MNGKINWTQENKTLENEKKTSYNGKFSLLFPQDLGWVHSL